MAGLSTRHIRKPSATPLEPGTFGARVTARRLSTAQAARVAEVCAERAQRRTMFPNWRHDPPSQLVQALDALQECYILDERMTGPQLAEHYGIPSARNLVSALRKAGYAIPDEPDQVGYLMTSAAPDRSAVLPHLPKPSMTQVLAQRLEQGLPVDCCDFCASSTCRLQREHGQPEILFGTTIATRWQLACGGCNSNKGLACRTCPNKTLRDMSMCDGCFWGNPNGLFTHAAGRPMVPARSHEQDALEKFRAAGTACGLSYAQTLVVLGAQAQVLVELALQNASADSIDGDAA